jgi:hypothetical protein
MNGWPTSHTLSATQRTTRRYLVRRNLPRVAHVLQTLHGEPEQEPLMSFPCSRRLAALAFVVLFAVSFVVAQAVAAG